MDPFAVFGIDRNTDDLTVRAKYLELVKQFPPERCPEQFAAIRAAYDQLKDAPARAAYRLFGGGLMNGLPELIEMVKRQAPRPRMSLQQLAAQSRRRS